MMRFMALQRQTWHMLSLQLFESLSVRHDIGLTIGLDIECNSSFFHLRVLCMRMHCLPHRCLRNQRLRGWPPGPTARVRPRMHRLTEVSSVSACVWPCVTASTSRCTGDGWATDARIHETLSICRSACRHSLRSAASKGTIGEPERPNK